MLNKSNFWPARGSDHSPSVKIATFRGPAKVQEVSGRSPAMSRLKPQRQVKLRTSLST
ncbi:MAG: hypothetical protein G5700_08370, partial [Serratia symbiotica]|nr:hypothetical protein [Serratia symbiotica]